MSRVIVLANDHSILGTTNWKRAAALITSGKAEMMAESSTKIHPKMNLPLAIKLIKAIANLHKKKVEWSKQNIHIRDNFTCQYCGKKVEKSRVTIDHVIPKDQGGKNLFENCVCSCFGCNNKKGNRTPDEAYMNLRKQPYRPSIMEFLFKKVKSEGLEKVLKDLEIY
jgi:5-methylcytosine-specific restriction endonuclease McrA